MGFLVLGCVAIFLYFSPPLPCAWVRSRWLRFFAFLLAVALSFPYPSPSAFLVSGSPSASLVPLPGRLVLADSLYYDFRFSLLHRRLPVLFYFIALLLCAFISGVLLPL